MYHNPKISIIVPVYKAEKYIEKCINSILTQSFTEFELLLIDDGSPDNSGKICDSYALKDNRIIVIHKINEGVSSARQCGLDNSKGEYLIHIDPDDWVENDMLESLYNEAVYSNSDMVICDFYYDFIKTSKTIHVKQKPTSLHHTEVLNDLFRHLHGSCCNKLIKRKCFYENNISFPKKLCFCEDLFVNACLTKNNIKITYLPKAFYHYIQDNNENSLVKTYSKTKLQHDIQMKELFLSLLKGYDAYYLCEYNMSYLIVKRAFDSELFTSKQFKQIFSKYSNSIKKYNNINSIYKSILLLSCNGYYKQSLFLLQIILRIKQILRK